MKAKILVTGGLGFIGSHTAVELIQAGYEVVIVDDLSNAQLFILDRIQQLTGVKPFFYEVNMQHKDALADVFATEKTIACVIHFAASKAVGESVVLPLKYYRNNLVCLIHLLECMEQYKVPSIVFSSSATVYGDPEVLPLTEQTAFKPSLSAYGSTKQMGEDMLQKVSATKTVQAIALRYFNPVGAHPSALIGELPLGKPNNLMPYVTQVAAGKLEQLTVYGNDYPTPDGTCIRDYIHVVDLAKAHVKSCERLLEATSENHFEAFNIGTGKGISVMELLHTFENENKVKVNYVIGNRRHGDAAVMYADVSLAAKELHWKADLGLKEMVTDAWRWQQLLS